MNAAAPQTAAAAVVDSRRLLRAALRVGAAALLLVGVVGLLHMPFAAPLLRRISPASLCPVTRGTPEQIDRSHAIGAAAIRASTTTSAPSRPALGFDLDRSTRADLDAWAQRHGIACASIGGNANLQRCGEVPAHAVGAPASSGALEEVSFELRSTGVLVNVETLRRRLTPEQAVAIVAERERAVIAAVGPPSNVGGDATVAHLSHGYLSSYVAEHTFADYRATVSATNMASGGMMVREQYLSVRP